MMAKEKYILVSHFCRHSHIENEFVQNLHEYGLVKIAERENDMFIDENDISKIERMFRLHNDLGINFEGLDAISQLMKRMGKLQSEMAILQNKLRLYE